MDISVWEAECASASLQKVERVLLEPGPDELVLEVLYCGLCHSDLSMIDNSWGISQYPLVPWSCSGLKRDRADPWVGLD